MLMLSPVVNTVPAMPAVAGNRISPTESPSATRAKSSSVRSSSEEQRRALGTQHAGRLGHHPLEERVEVELGGDVRHEPEELHLLGPPGVDVLEVGRADQCRRCLAGHGLDQREVVEVVVARALVEHLGDADHDAAGGPDRRAHEVAGRVPGQLVDVAVEPRIRIGVVDDEGLVRGEDPAGDADIVEQADLERLLALQHPRVELAGGRIVEEQGPAVGIRSRGRSSR